MKDFKLDDYPKINTGFTTPVHYFEYLPEQIMKKLPSQKPKVLPIFKRRNLWLTTAAAILVIALCVPLYNTINPINKEIDLATMENYFSYRSTISQYDLVNLLDDKDVEAIDLDIEVEDNTIEELLTTNKNFENYIID